VRIDNTPPGVRASSRDKEIIEIVADDAASPVSEAEYSLDARKWTRVEAQDGLADSPHEVFVIRVPKESGGAYLLVRVTDAARNVATASFAAP
jgi:hypothetical protein